MKNIKKIKNPTYRKLRDILNTMSDEELDTTIDVGYCYYATYGVPIKMMGDVSILSLNENDKGKRFISMQLFFEGDEL